MRKLHTQYESSEIALTSRFSQLWLLVTLRLGLVIPGPANNLMGYLAQVISFPPHSMLLVQQTKILASYKYHKQPPAKPTFSTRRLDCT